MEKTALQKILNAEKMADDIIAEGVKKARDVSEKSALKIKAMNAEFEEQIERDVRKIVNEKIEEAEKDARKLEASFEAECTEIKEKASLNIEKAVDYVVEKVGSGRWQ